MIKKIALLVLGLVSIAALATIFFNNLQAGNQAGSDVVSDWYVSPSGDDTSGHGTLAKPWHTIRMALDKASSGNTIHLLPGTYLENLKITRNINIIGESGNPADSIIDGRNLSPVITVEAAKFNLKQVTVRNGLGGIILRAGASGEITNNILSDNSAFGISQIWGDASISGNLIRNIDGFGIGGQETTFTISGNVIEKCARDGILLATSDTRIFNNIIGENGRSGVNTGRGGSQIIENNLIFNNAEYGIMEYFGGGRINNNIIAGHAEGINNITPQPDQQVYDNMIYRDFSPGLLDSARLLLAP